MKRKIGILLFASLLSACSPIEYNAFSSIAGTVINAEERIPISGASVVLRPSGKISSTDSVGNFQFGDLDAGQYTIQVRKDGFQTETRTVTTFANEIENIVIPMTYAD